MCAKVNECARAKCGERNAREGCMQGMVVTVRSHLTELVLVTQDPHLVTQDSSRRASRYTRPALDLHLDVWPRHTQEAPAYLAPHLCVATIFYDDDLVYVLGMPWG